MGFQAEPLEDETGLRRDETDRIIPNQEILRVEIEGNLCATRRLRETVNPVSTKHFKKSPSSRALQYAPGPIMLTVADFKNLQSNPVRYLHHLSYHVAN
ncbi:hypothetical protein L596_017365 [Steinernema carpocapsae]|uniref:Uncharacterized protein n=1 Tax=Steinernema carpocapsae TaxID=34508 RepID=A0A4U5N1P7_STECR|nr:hypothetical protein L596_017365 [Steinernema carpocapsae]